MENFLIFFDFSNKKNINKLLITLPFIVIIILFFKLITFTKSHNCGFHNIKHKSASQLKKESEENLTESDKLLDQRFLQTNSNIDLSPKQSIFLPIRIYFDYTTLDNQSMSFSPALIQGIKKILSQTKDLLEKLINIKRYNYPLRVKSCDNSITISDIVKTGIDTDLVIFPFLDSELANTSVEAYATACAISTIDNRPISGLIGFSPNFSIEKINWESYYRNLALHELTHVLVFNPNLFEFFRDEKGNPYKKDNVMKYKIINGMPRNLLAYPKLLSAAKKHFNCDRMEGVEVENQGGEGKETKIYLYIIYLLNQG
jgi:hypothetical protein